MEEPMDTLVPKENPAPPEKSTPPDIPAPTGDRANDNLVVCETEDYLLSSDEENGRAIDARASIRHSGTPPSPPTALDRRISSLRIENPSLAERVWDDATPNTSQDENDKAAKKKKGKGAATKIAVDASPKPKDAGSTKRDDIAHNESSHTENVASTSTGETTKGKAGGRSQVKNARPGQPRKGVADAIAAANAHNDQNSEGRAWPKPPPKEKIQKKATRDRSPSVTSRASSRSEGVRDSSARFLHWNVKKLRPSALYDDEEDKHFASCAAAMLEALDARRKIAWAKKLSGYAPQPEEPETEDDGDTAESGGRKTSRKKKKRGKRSFHAVSDERARGSPERRHDDDDEASGAGATSV